MTEKTLLFHGRFQPPHIGHIKLLQSAVEKYDNPNIVISIDNRPPDNNNPFSFEERKTLWQKLLKNLMINLTPAIIKHDIEKPSFDNCIERIYN